MSIIHIQQWDAKKFLNSKEEWNELLDHSRSDKLFLSWEWQYSWWKIFSDPAKMQLRLYAATTDDGKLVGIAPLYSTTAVTKKFLKTERLQFIGNRWRGEPTMPTELLDFIADENLSSDVIRAFYTHISSLEFWDEFIIPFLNTQSDTYQLLLNENLLSRCNYRHAEKYNSYYLTLQGTFQDYTRDLGKNTRLKLFNRRTLLNSLGNVSFERMRADDVEAKLKLLSGLHSIRWNKPVFQGARLEFNITVASLMAERNCLNFSVLSLNDQPVSIQYNFVIDQHNYNIQSGFDESFHKKISLGYLHFGYEIEASFDQHNTTFDFLAGAGKNTQYKERLTDRYLQLVDLQIIRKPALKLLYRLYDMIR